MEKAEREFLLRRLGTSRERLVEAVEGLDQRQQRYRAAADLWSIADCVEHVMLFERAVLKQMQSVLLAPRQPAGIAVSDEAVLARASLQSPPFISPEEFQPRRRWSDFEDLLRQFETARERTVRFAGVTRADLRGYSFPHHTLGELDCYQWLLFLAAHCERHARQAAQIEGDMRFPRLEGSASA